MQAILYICHGSRVQAGVDQAKQFIEQCKVQLNAPIQEICFLELSAPNIAQGVAKCVMQGAAKIVMIPVLLLTAHHAKRDIPMAIESAKRLYPHITFTYGNTFGIHDKLVDALNDRIKEQPAQITGNAHVLLVGRGSSDPAAKRDLTRIADRLKEKYAFKQVDVCFLYGAAPHFVEALHNLRLMDTKQVFIIPYLLFTGLLMKQIKRGVALHRTNKQRLILCEGLGYHQNAQRVLVERAVALLT